MVSQAQIVDRTTAQSTASLVSRPSSRRHRSGRSHHGGSSHPSSNDFPVFTYTGDTEVVIRTGSQERRYLLHKLILSQCSGYFEASTNEGWSRQMALGPSKPEGTLSRLSEDDDLSNGSTLAPSDNGGISTRPTEKRRWRYELDWENRAEDEEAILVQKVCLAPARRIILSLPTMLMSRVETATDLCPHVQWRPSYISSNDDQTIQRPCRLRSIYGEPSRDAVGGPPTADRGTRCRGRSLNT